MDLQLNDAVVIVTGGTSGIGLAVVRELLAEGARPVAVARHEPDVGLFPEGVDFTAADVSEPRGAQSLVESVVGRHGKLDGLVHCAALFESRDSFANSEDALWRATFAVKFFGLLRLTRAAIRTWPSQAAVSST